MKKSASHRYPLVAAAWSTMLPGLGQFYNRDYFVGLVLVILELSFNYLGGINCEIIKEFNPAHPDVDGELNHDWLMFYPSMYVFSIWHGYYRAIEINTYLGEEIREEQQHCYTAILAAIGMLIGIIWPIDHKHILSGLGFGFVGVILGVVIHFSLKWFKAKKQSN